MSPDVRRAADGWAEHVELSGGAGKHLTCLATTRPANPWGAAGGYSFAGDSCSHQPRQRLCALRVGRCHAMAIAFTRVGLGDTDAFDTLIPY
jgi:hypothetical protein